MPTNIDVLIERLKLFDEVSLIDLLGLTSEDIIDRFMDVIEDRKDYLFGEVELFSEEDEEVDELDGYQVEEYNIEE